VVTGAPVTVVICAGAVVVAVFVVVTGAPVTVVVCASAVWVVVLVTVFVLVTVLTTVSVVVFGVQALNAPAAITTPPAMRKFHLDISFLFLDIIVLLLLLINCIFNLRIFSDFICLSNKSSHLLFDLAFIFS